MNTALNRSVVLVLTNKSGGNLAKGAVVVIDLNNDEAVTTTTTPNYINTFPGVVIEPNGIANNAAGLVAFGGYIPQINLTGAADVGDKISTSSVAGQGLASGAEALGSFAIALSSGNTPKALILGLNFSSSTTVVDKVSGRITPQSGYPIPTGSFIVTGTLYYTPSDDNIITLYNTGTGAWNSLEFTEQPISISGLTSGTNFDVFVYLSGTTGILFETLAWSSDVSRATDITRFEGRFVKSGSVEKRYLGSFRTTQQSVTEDSLTKRFIWNYYNRQDRILKIYEDESSWTYDSDTPRPVNNDPANRVEVIIGVSEIPFEVITYMPYSSSSSTVGFGTAFALDATNVISSDFYGTAVNGDFSQGGSSFFEGLLSKGYHYFQWVEFSSSGVTVTFYGTAATVRRPGLFSKLEG